MSSPDAGPREDGSEVSAESGSESADRWELIRDLLTFQVKLAIDALRDVVLVPVSIVAGVVDLATGGDRQGQNFYRVVRLGRRSERWINLFGAVEDPGEYGEEQVPSLDSLVGQVERLVIEHVEHGGMTATAKQAIDRSLDRVAEVTQGRRGSDGDSDPDATRPETSEPRS